MIEIKKNRISSKLVWTVLLTALSLVCLFIIIGIIIGPDKKPSDIYDVERLPRYSQIEHKLRQYASGLKEGNLLVPYTLDTAYTLKLLNDSGAKWEMDPGDKYLLVGWVPANLWRELLLERKEWLLKNIIVNMVQIAGDNWYQSIVIKDDRNGKVLAKNSPWTGLSIYE